MKSKTATLLVPCALALAAYASSAHAQNAEAPAPAAPAAPAAPSYPGALPPAGYNPDAHLPSSSRSSNDASRSADGFDLGNRGGGGPASIRGNAAGAYIVEGSFVPDGHTVRRGDTLWDISGRYYQSPYQWPRVWGLNPQIHNPHWIYPGDRVRLREGGGPMHGNVGFGGRRRVPPQTVFLRDVGWLDDRKDDTWGELVGSPSDRMLLSEGDDIYVQIDGDHQVMVGEQLTIFRPIRTVDSKNAKGDLVSIRGTARIDRYNPRSKMVRARIIESIDTIERGAKIGPVGRKFDVVPPVTSDRDLEASILASVYPFQVYGQHQVVFIDRGEKDGVKPGQRFFAIRRGDRWLQTLGAAGQMAAVRPRMEDDHPAQVEKIGGNVDPDKLPDETYAELRVLRVRDHSATALVVASKHEIERNARLVSRKGF